MVNVVNEILETNNINLLEMYYNLFHEVPLINVEYSEAEIISSDTKINKTKVLETIKYLYIQELTLLPLGSVIELDDKFLGDGVKNILFVVTNRLLISKETNDSYDYEVVQYPGAVQDNGKRLYITREFIKNVVQKGFSNEVEIEFVNSVRMKCMENKIVSRIFISLENKEFNVGGLNHE